MFDFLEGRLFDDAGDTGAGGSGGSEVALLDTGADLDTTVDDGADSEVIDAEIVDPVADPAETTAVARYNPTEANGRFSSRATKDLQAIRKSSPLLFQQIMRDRTDATRLRSMAPADKKPFEYTSYLQKTIKDLGGEEGIQALRGKSDTFDELDEMFTQANPQVLDKYLMGDPQGISAIMKLLPHVVARVEKLEGGPAVLLGMFSTLEGLQNRVAPNAATKNLAGGIQRTLDSFRLKYHFTMLASLVDPANEIGKESYAAVKEFFSKVESALQLVPEILPEAPAPKVADKSPEIDQRQRELEQRETNFKREQWRATSGTDKNRIMLKSWADLSKGKQISPVVREDVQVAIGSRLMQAAKAAGLDAALEGFFQKNDTVGYQRYLANFYQTNIPRIMKAELEKRVKKAGTVAAVTPPKPGQPQRTPPPQQGFVKVATAPHYNEIDAWKSTPDMAMKKQAVLKDGRKVYWV
jgi:hypothetical protein